MLLLNEKLDPSLIVSRSNINQHDEKRKAQSTLTNLPKKKDIISTPKFLEDKTIFRLQSILSKNKTFFFINYTNGKRCAQ
jgi:hypothetical protein